MPRKANLTAFEMIALEVARGASVQEAGRRRKVSPSQVKRISAMSGFREAVARCRKSIVDRAVGQAAMGAVEGVRVLRKLLKSGDENVKLRAAVELAKTLVGLQDHIDWGARLEALEGRSGPRPTQQDPW
jgi:hypothetical protein